MKHMDDLDRSFDRWLRAMIGCGVAYIGCSIVRVGAAFGPIAPLLAWSLVIVGIVAFLVGMGTLISAPFLHRGVSPRDGDVWKDAGRGETVHPSDAHTDEPCHCMNCLNKRAW